MIAIDPAPQHIECQVNLGIRPHKKRRARGKYRLCCMTHACIVHRKEKLVKLIVFFYAKSRVIMTCFAYWIDFFCLYKAEIFAREQRKGWSKETGRLSGRSLVAYHAILSSVQTRMFRS